MTEKVIKKSYSGTKNTFEICHTYSKHMKRGTLCLRQHKSIKSLARQSKQ